MHSETRRSALLMQSCCSETEAGEILWKGSTKKLPGSRAGAVESVRKRHRSVSNRSKRARLIDFKMKAFTVGVPALFARVTFNELRNLPSDGGAKQLNANCDDHAVPMSTPEAGCDIDAPED